MCIIIQMYMMFNNKLSLICGLVPTFYLICGKKYIYRRCCRKAEATEIKNGIQERGSTEKFVVLSDIGERSS